MMSTSPTTTLSYVANNDICRCYSTGVLALLQMEMHNLYSKVVLPLISGSSDEQNKKKLLYLVHFSCRNNADVDDDDDAIW